MIVMGEVRKYELRVPDLDAHDVVDNPRLLDVPQVYEINSELLADGWFHDIANKLVKFIVVELHGDEAVIPIEIAAFLLLVLFPAVQAEITCMNMVPSISLLMLPTVIRPRSISSSKMLSAICSLGAEMSAAKPESSSIGCPKSDT